MPPVYKSKTPKSYALLLDQCTTLPHLKQLHASLTTSGLFLTHPFFHAKLIHILTTTLKSSHIALQILSHSPNPKPFAYNTLIQSLSLSPTPRNALHLFAKMLHPPSPSPNSSSFTFTLKSCARSHSHKDTKVVHGLAITFGYQSSDHVVNTALHAYASCSDLVSARKLFEVIPSQAHETIKWNAMISGYVQNGVPKEAIDLFRRMWVEGVVPTVVTVITVLSGCALLKFLSLGRQIHGFLSKSSIRIEREINVGTALLDMYAKCGCVDLAKRVFDVMERRDTGVWNALIGGYVSGGYFLEALRSFNDLVSSGINTPDAPTFVSTLCACAHLGALDVGKRIHGCMEVRYHRLDATVDTSLIEMYSKCGCIDIARQLFDRMTDKDAMAWSSMIVGLAAHGHADDALGLFDLMKKCGCKPDGVTFLGVLSACRHAGLVDKGLGYFESMKREHEIKPRVEHCGCMIDLLSRAGRLTEALEFINSMEVDANPIIWRSVLSGCRPKLDVEMAEVAVENLRKLRSGHCGDYVLLSNIYALKGRWEDARRVRSWMEEAEIKKLPAFSSI